tara:strand:+ start:324 stop:491 length:168 start_codon:yes stop_codon:yes gene_type:complete
MSHDTKRWTIELDEVEYTFMTQEEYDVEVYLQAREPDWDDMSVAERQVMLDECMS